MQNRILYLLIGLVAAVLVGRASVFTVGEGQLAIKLTGGEIVESDYEPGLHFRIPLVNEVRRFDKRIITQLYPSERFLTREQEQLNVDFYVKWRIDNPQGSARRSRTASRASSRSERCNRSSPRNAPSSPTR